MNVPFTSSVGVIRNAEDIEKLEGKALLAVHNELSNASVKKFADRKSGLKRTLTAFATWQGQQTEKPIKEVTEPSELKSFRPDSLRGKVISAASKAGGATFGDLKKLTGWEDADLKAALSRIETYNGLTVTKEGEGDAMTVVITGTLRTRKAFAFDPKPEQKPVKEGTKRHTVLVMLQSKDGATFDQIKEVTKWDNRTAYEGVRLLHHYSGYGLRESGDGRITAYTK